VVKIAVIGDSTAMQFGSVETCWPREMCLEVERVLDCKVNLKLMGAYFQTAERALRRNVQRAVKFDPDLIVLAVGCSEAVWQFPAALHRREKVPHRSVREITGEDSPNMRLPASVGGVSAQLRDLGREVLDRIIRRDSRLSGALLRSLGFRPASSETEFDFAFRQMLTACLDNDRSQIVVALSSGGFSGPCPFSHRLLATNDKTMERVVKDLGSPDRVALFRRQSWVGESEDYLLDGVHLSNSAHKRLGGAISVAALGMLGREGVELEVGLPV
jgi:lysophospholipase L1-like esterase